MYMKTSVPVGSEESQVSCLVLLSVAAPGGVLGVLETGQTCPPLILPPSAALRVRIDY